ncbi:hypothetical protein FISHEDRAFT_62869 [Fistulina hepatica ATCC 64428]|uniref:Uncharacterized protein n=1 Tax=Fistulina hepatica ATCC 64428 TaxID=1128425 RepID=A0A0D6ZZF9_9AGAR|nr:hypothetical protein FISHEDRAFT_62869 [Fistulina hepatica ATCC 64428]
MPRRLTIGNSMAVWVCGCRWPRRPRFKYIDCMRIGFARAFHLADTHDVGLPIPCNCLNKQTYGERQCIDILVQVQTTPAKHTVWIIVRQGRLACSTSLRGNRKLSRGALEQFTKPCLLCVFLNSITTGEYRVKAVKEEPDKIHNAGVIDRP